MSDVIVSIDWSEIRVGKLEDLKVAIKELVDFVDTNEPRPLAYHVYLNEDGTRMTVVQVHPDSASMEHHMSIAGSAFPTFKGLLELNAIDVYGTASETLLGLLRQKAQVLGGATVAVHGLHAGFTRFGGR